MPKVVILSGDEGHWCIESEPFIFSVDPVFNLALGYVSKRKTVTNFFFRRHVFSDEPVDWRYRSFSLELTYLNSRGIP